MPHLLPGDVVFLFHYMTYSEKLKDPRWQKKRLRILERDNWTCRRCLSADKTLHVHHRYYIKGANPWEYHDEVLRTLCEDCHLTEERIILQKKTLLKNLQPKYEYIPSHCIACGDDNIMNYHPLFYQCSFCGWMAFYNDFSSEYPDPIHLLKYKND